MECLGHGTITRLQGSALPAFQPSGIGAGAPARERFEGGAAPNGVSNESPLGRLEPLQQVDDDGSVAGRHL